MHASPCANSMIGCHKNLVQPLIVKNPNELPNFGRENSLTCRDRDAVETHKLFSGHPFIITYELFCFKSKYCFSITIHTYTSHANSISPSHHVCYNLLHQQHRNCPPIVAFCHWWEAHRLSNRMISLDAATECGVTNARWHYCSTYCMFHWLFRHHAKRRRKTADRIRMR